MLRIPPLRINDCGIADYPTGGQLGPRTMSDYEILWIERGNCAWEHDGRVEECNPGSILMCPPGMRDTWYWDPEATTRHGFIHFDFLSAFSAVMPSRRIVSDNDVLRPLLRHAIWLASHGDAGNDELAAQALRHALTWYLNGHFEQGTVGTSRDLHPVILRALRALHQIWGDGHKVPPGMDAWAKAAGVSRGHLARVCRQELDVSPQELMRYLRLDHGLLLLARTNYKISRVSEICGFQSQFHFSRCFKEAYELSPRDLRAQLREGGDKPLSKLVGLRRMVQIVG